MNSASYTSRRDWVTVSSTLPPDLLAWVDWLVNERLKLDPKEATGRAAIFRACIAWARENHVNVAPLSTNTNHGEVSNGATLG